MLAATLTLRNFPIYVYDIGAYAIYSSCINNFFGGSGNVIDLLNTSFIFSECSKYTNKIGRRLWPCDVPILLLNGDCTLSFLILVLSLYCWGSLHIRACQSCPSTMNKDDGFHELSTLDHLEQIQDYLVVLIIISILLHVFVLLLQPFAGKVSWVSCARISFFEQGDKQGCGLGGRRELLKFSTTALRTFPPGFYSSLCSLACLLG